MIRAAVYVPLGVPDDGRFTVEAVDRIQYLGYEYAGTYRQPYYVDKLLREGIVSVVVLARARHWDPECGWPVVFVDDPTRRINEASSGFVARGDGGFAERFLNRRRLAKARDQ